MRSRFLVIFPLLLLSTLISCTEESVPHLEYGTISISFQHPYAAPEARLQADKLRKASHVVITIIGMDGQDTDYTEKKVEVYEFEGSYLVDNIVLPIGSYQISTLYLVDDEDHVLFATPDKDKPLAQHVKIPLPATISSNKMINEVKMEVLSTTGLTPDDFGLESLELNFGDTFYFFVALLEEGEKGDFLEGKMTVSSEGYNSTLNIDSYAQKIILEKGYDRYNIKVENKEYHPYEGSFSYDSLRVHASTPLIITLESIIKPDQGIYVGNVVLNTQQEVDDFGDKGYTKIEGTLNIGGYFPTDPQAITDLGPLASLTAITGRLQILNNRALTSFHGLHNLSSVGGFMSISGNVRLESLAALKNLNYIGSGLTLSQNNALTNLDGLQGLSSLTSNSQIEGNQNLISLEGLENLKTLSFLFLTSNRSLASVKGLNNLRDVGGLSISGNSSLISLSGFGNAITSLDNFSIRDNPLLTDFKGMMSPEGEITSSVSIENNASLESLEGLEFNPDIVFDFEIKDNPLLVDISAMNDINTIGRSLTISGNKKLSSLKGLENLFSVGNRHNMDLNYLLTIVNNPSINDFCALSYLFQEGVVHNQNIALNAYNPSRAQMKAGECSQ